MSLLLSSPSPAAVGGPHGRMIDRGYKRKANQRFAAILSSCYNDSFSCKRLLNLSVCPSIAKLQCDNSSEVLGSKSLVTAFDPRSKESVGLT